MPTNPVAVTDHLFTAANIASVGIATGAVNVATNALYKLAPKLPARWVAFSAAMLIAYIAVFISSNPQWYDWVLAFFNGCLLFCSALGVNELGAAALSTGGKGFVKTKPLIKSWLKV